MFTVLTCKQTLFKPFFIFRNFIFIVRFSWQLNLKRSLINTCTYINFNLLTTDRKWIQNKIISFKMYLQRQWQDMTFWMRLRTKKYLQQKLSFYVQQQSDMFYVAKCLFKLLVFLMFITVLTYAKPMEWVTSFHSKSKILFSWENTDGKLLE